MKSISRLLVAALSLVVATVPLLAQWIQIGEIPYSAQHLVVSGPNLIAGGGGLYVSSDGGITWARSPIVGPDSSVTALTVAPNQTGGTQLLASSYGRRIFRSTDHGNTWSVAGSLPQDTRISDFAASGPYLFAGTFAGVFRSSDNGVTWFPANNGLPARIGPPLINCFAVLGTRLFSGTVNDGLFLSTNHGTTWNLVTAGLSASADVLSILATRPTLVAGVHGAGLFRSTDSGATWRQSNTTFAGAKLTSADDFAAYGSRMFAAQSSLGIWISVDSGAHWAPVNTGLPSVTLMALAIYGTDLYTVAYHSVCRRPLSQLMTSVRTGGASIPTHQFLAQNYPNPFNPTTTISFTLAAESFVTLDITDILGRQVAQLAADVLPAGRHVRQWNAQNLPGGVYFYRLQAGTLYETRKLLMLK